MSLTKEKKSELIGKYGRGDSDTGSAEVQIALATERINELTEHLRTHTKTTTRVAACRCWSASAAACSAPERRPRALPRPGRRSGLRR